MASLFKRGETYWAQVYDHGKRKRISLGTGAPHCYAATR